MLADRRYRQAITTLLGVAIVLFVFTVVVGILNGTDIVDFERKVLLTHVHAGTLGWITLAVFASALWLFGGTDDATERDRTPEILAYLSAAGIVAYVVAFLTTDGWVRPILGGLVSLAFLAFFVWTVTRKPLRELSVPQLGFVVALFTSVVGGVLGTLWGVLVASGYRIKALPEDGVDAHPAMMVIGFLVPVGAAMAEWWLLPDRAERGPSPRPKGGAWQMGLLFVGSLLIMLGLLTNVPPLIMVSQPFLIAALVIVIVRLWSPARSALERPMPWWHAILGLAWIIFAIGYTIVLVNIYEGDFDDAPVRLILALDHAMFIGAMTNSVFALLIAATVASRTSLADRLVLAGINLGLVGFWLGLVADVTVLKQISTPIMGAAILLGLALAAQRLAKPTTLADYGP
jgi:hypothetical protein